MDLLLQFWAWLHENYLEVVTLVGTAIALAEAVVRLTPTKTDDGAVQRFGEMIKRVLDVLRVPNVKKAQPPEEKK